MRRVLLGLASVLLPGCVASSETPPSGERALREARACTSLDAAWSKLGPVRGLPEALARGDGALAPSLVETDGVLHLWYAEKTGSRYAIRHATSVDDGASFDVPEVVSGLGEEHLHTYPNVWREGGSYRMAFGSGSIKLASSEDGVRFTLSEAPLLRASFATGRFDALSVLYPSRVVAAEGRGELFFSGYDGQRIRIGRAVERADGSYAVDPERPVIEPGQAPAFDNTSVAQPHLVRDADRYTMFYGGYDTSVTNPGPYRIGRAVSTDGITWTKLGIAVELSPSGTDAWSTRDPALSLTKERALMVYSGLGDDGRYRLHRAVAACE